VTRLINIPRTAKTSVCRAVLLAVLAACSVHCGHAATGRVIRTSLAFEQPKIETIGAHTRVDLPQCDSLERGNQPIVPFRVARVLLPPGHSLQQAVVRPATNAVVIEKAGRLELASASGAGRLPRLVRIPAEQAEQPASGVRTLSQAFPREQLELLSVQILRGHSIAILRVFPVQYLAAKEQLLFTPRMDLELTLIPSDSIGNIGPAHVSTTRDDSMANWVDNPELLSEYQTPPTNAAAAFDYLLITKSALTNSFAPLVRHKQQAGLSVSVVTMEHIVAVSPGRDTPERVRNYIRFAHTNSGVRFVLLGGDTGTVPCRYAYANVARNERECAVPSDLYYACLDGSWNSDDDNHWGEADDGDNGADVDLLAEVWVGRAPADTAAEAEAFVEKTIRYAATRHSRPASAGLLGCYLGFLYPGVHAQGGAMFDSLLPRLRHLTLTRLDDRPSPGPQWTTADAISFLNTSPHLVLYSGHGDSDTLLRLKSPDVKSLTNAEPFLLYSVGCNGGQFDNNPLSPDAIGEEFLKVPRHGAVAAILNSRLGWFDPRREGKFSGEYQVKFFDRLLAGSPARLGITAQSSKQDMLALVEKSGLMPYRWCYYGINLLGDPHLAVAVAGGASITQPGTAESADAVEPGPRTSGFVERRVR
jgi:Peptidase family C25